MDWIKIIENALRYIEENLSGELTVGMIAEKVNISPFYFQKGFSMLCGYSVGEYIRMRRLSVAGSELVTSDNKVIDLALKYGYDSPDSFTKAFTRFHGSTPTDVRRKGALLKSFAPLHIKIILDGGNTMEYRVEEKPAFRVMGVSKIFSYETANADIPQYWDEIHVQAAVKPVEGMYGICFDEEMGGNRFRYMIADDLEEGEAEEKNLETYEVPRHTWAIFPCRGAMPLSIQEVNRRIFSEWLPAGNYEIAEGYNIEYYSDSAEFKDGTQDPDYYAEVWIPVRERR
ncbi:MAG: AraC family transcriptional regulator [Lachnospiraceae bacterium]|nr:AraC family transcriptional regulator [Lachnospiraceae bacterium]MCI9343789.1 AraC family transcriptional regulator [Lachnospiraceae bacterium]